MLLLRSTGEVVGTAGFKAPPSDGGVVELAYGIEPDHQGKGYATEAAAALAELALSCAEVRIVRRYR